MDKKNELKYFVINGQDLILCDYGTNEVIKCCIDEHTLYCTKSFEKGIDQFLKLSKQFMDKGTITLEEITKEKYEELNWLFMCLIVKQENIINEKKDFAKAIKEYINKF